MRRTPIPGWLPLAVGLFGALPAAADQTAVRVSLQVDAIVGSGQRRLLAPGEVLRAGDSIALSVSVDRAAYLCVVHAAGARAVLFPSAGAPLAPVLPGAPLLVPPPGQSLRLDDVPGAEDLYVVALLTPPASADALREECLRRLDKPPPPPPPKELPPPRPIDGTERDPRPRFDPGSRTLRAVSDRSGAVLLRFPYQHQRRGVTAPPPRPSPRAGSGPG